MGKVLVAAHSLRRWLLPDEGENDDISDDFNEAVDDTPRERTRFQDRLLDLWHKAVPLFKDGGDKIEPDIDSEYNYDMDQDDVMPDDFYDESASEDDGAESSEIPAHDHAAATPQRRQTIDRLPNKPVRLTGGSNRRAANIHSPYAKRIRQTEGSDTVVVSNVCNTLQWNRTQGLLVITENTPQDSGEQGGRAVEVSARLLTDRVVPLLVGVMEAIDDAARFAAAPKKPAPAEAGRVRRAQRIRQLDKNAPWWQNDLPYMIESGQNTFIWYRNSRKLQVTREKHLDDRGLMLSGKSVILHVDALDESAKPVFEEILKMRSYSRA